MANHILVVGLGNPGIKYQHTRHNAGFMAIEHIAKEHGFPHFKSSLKYRAVISQGEIGKTKIVLVKPKTFMNNSGKAVKALVGDLVSLLETKSPSQELIVIHDDIDIPLGKIKISEGSGSAGHKGVESIIREIGGKDFTRIRIGIQPLEGKPANVEDFVLQKFSLKELPLLQQSLIAASASILDRIKDGKEKAE